MIYCQIAANLLVYYGKRKEKGLQLQHKEMKNKYEMGESEGFRKNEENKMNGQDDELIIRLDNLNNIETIHS